MSPWQSCDGLYCFPELSSRNLITNAPLVYYKLIRHRDLERSSIFSKSIVITYVCCPRVLPRWLSGKESARNAGNIGSVHGSGRSPREGNGNPFQHSCLEHSMDRGAARGVPKSLTQLSTWAHAHTLSKRQMVAAYQALLVIHTWDWNVFVLMPLPVHSNTLSPRVGNKMTKSLLLPPPPALV